MSLPTILTLIFMVLKLTSYIDWPWVYILFPTILRTVIWIAMTIWWESKTPEEKIRHVYRKRFGL